MPTIGETIKFKAGLYEDYAALPSSDIDVNTIYFCTDTQQLFVGDSEYTRKIQTGQGAPTAQSASDMPVGTLYYDSTNEVLYSNLSNSWTAVSDKNAPIDITNETVDANDLLLDDVEAGVRCYYCSGNNLSGAISNVPKNFAPFFLLVTKSDRAGNFQNQKRIIQKLYAVDTLNNLTYIRSFLKLSDGTVTQNSGWRKLFSTSTATKNEDGLMSSADKIKVDAIPANPQYTDTTYSEATTSSSGLMSSSDKVKVDAIPANPQYTDTTYSAATQSTDGLMSSTDKTKLDSLGGSYYGTCASTEASNQVKNIVISNEIFSLQTGTIIGIKFAASNTYSSTAAAPVKFTFNSDTTQYPIYYKNAVSPTGTATAVYGLANYITYYMFDGTNLVWVGQDVDNNTDTKVAQSVTPATGTFDLLMAKTAGSHTAETNTAYKSGANLNYDVANSKLKVGGQNVLTAADIVVCTQAEYDAMSTRTGLLYFIKEATT